jgi:hypothetical protein
VCWPRPEYAPCAGVDPGQLDSDSRRLATPSGTVIVEGLSSVPLRVPVSGRLFKRSAQKHSMRFRLALKLPRADMLGV